MPEEVKLPELSLEKEPVYQSTIMKNIILTLLAAHILQTEAKYPAPAILSTLYGYDNCIGGINYFGTREEYMEDLMERNCTVVTGPTGQKITNVVNAFRLKVACGIFFSESWLDGMPVVFNYPLTVIPDIKAFELTLSDNSKVHPLCAVLGPANEQNENDTLLLLGQFGDGAKDTLRPVKLSVVGDVMLYTPGGEVNVKGLTYQDDLDMNYMKSSVRLVYARMWDVKQHSESFRHPTWPLPSQTYPNSCTDLFPSTSHVVRMAFSGGPTLDGANSVLPHIESIFTVKRADDLKEVPYLGLADLGRNVDAEEETTYTQDGDNYLDICLDLKESPEVLDGDLLVDLNCDEDDVMLYPPKGKPYGCKSQQVLLTSENTYGHYIKMWE